jgi:uncharacterized protein
MPKTTKAQLQRVTDVYYHEACPDGTASAFICAAAFHESKMHPRFSDLQYGTEKMQKLQAKTGQLFVDITPPEERWQEWLPMQPLVLDHHATVKAVTEGLNGVYATNESHSGAQIAYEEVFQVLLPGWDTASLDEDWRTFAQLSMIRDTWKKDHPQWRDACAIAMALLFEGSRGLVDKAQQCGIDALDLKALLELGRKIVDSNERRVAKVAKSIHRETCTFDKTYKLSFFNCTEKLVSDIANHLIDQGDNVSVGYFFMEEDGANRVVVSIRTDGSVSARKMAEHLGGGGHERAAGFRIPNGDNTAPSDVYKTITDAIGECASELAIVERANCSAPSR